MKNNKNKKENINNIIKKYKEKNLLDNLDLLNKFLEEINKNKICEINKLGEVMTPSWLINEILDKLDEIHKQKYNKSIFEEKYSWFDPCCGIGNFHIEIYKRLINYHKKEEIIKKMFYGNEINKKNVFLYKMIFRKNSNINCSNSLELEDKKYDIIIGNPPYNSGTKNTGTTIYQKFIKKFINNYKKYFSFINPPCWRKPNIKSCVFYGLYDLMTKDNHLCYLSIHNNKEGLRTFNAGTRYDWYIIDKNINNKESIIYGLDKKEYKIKCEEWEFLPNGKYNDYKNMYDFKMINNIKILYSRSAYGADKKYVSKIQNEEYKYPLIHTTPLNSNITYRYSKYNDKGFFGIKKIIFGIGGINPIIDENGEYGMTQMSVGIEYKTKEEEQKIIKCLKSKEFNKFLTYNIWGGGFGIEYLMFNYLKKDFYNYI